MSHAGQPSYEVEVQYRALVSLLSKLDLATVQHIASDNGDAFTRVERYAAHEVLKNPSLT